MFTSLLVLLLSITISVALQCDCGFKDPLDPTSALYTDYFEADFTTISPDQLSQMFRIMHGDVKKKGTARQFHRDNIVIDKKGLHLTVKASSKGSGVPSAEIFTKNTNFGFGSYHWSARTSSVVGTVQGFYVYKSDHNEIDIEYVSKPADQQQTFLYSVKPQLYAPNGAASNSTLIRYTPPFDTCVGFHTHSFVWNPSGVIYSVDNSNWTEPLTTNVPSQSGVIAMTHWSDGNPRYSGGPPVRDSVLTINRVWVFYNSSAAETTLSCQNSKQPCTVGETEPLVTNMTKTYNVPKKTYRPHSHKIRTGSSFHSRYFGHRRR